MRTSRLAAWSQLAGSSCALELLEARKYLATIIGIGRNPVGEEVSIAELTPVGSHIYFSAGRSIFMKASTASGENLTSDT